MGKVKALNIKFDLKITSKPLKKSEIKLFPLVEQFVCKLSGGIRVRIPHELDVVAFWSWNLDVVVF